MNFNRFVSAKSRPLIITCNTYSQKSDTYMLQWKVLPSNKLNYLAIQTKKVRQKNKISSYLGSKFEFLFFFLEFVWSKQLLVNFQRRDAIRLTLRLSVYLQSALNFIKNKALEIQNYHSLTYSCDLINKTKVTIFTLSRKEVPPFSLALASNKETKTSYYRSNPSQNKIQYLYQLQNLLFSCWIFFLFQTEDSEKAVLVFSRDSWFTPHKI